MGVSHTQEMCFPWTSSFQILSYDSKRLQNPSTTVVQVAGLDPKMTPCLTSVAALPPPPASANTALTAHQQTASRPNTWPSQRGTHKPTTDSGQPFTSFPVTLFTSGGPCHLLRLQPIGHTADPEDGADRPPPRGPCAAAEPGQRGKELPDRQGGPEEAAGVGCTMKAPSLFPLCFLVKRLSLVFVVPFSLHRPVFATPVGEERKRR